MAINMDRQRTDAVLDAYIALQKRLEDREHRIHDLEVANAWLEAEKSYLVRLAGVPLLTPSPADSSA